MIAQILYKGFSLYIIAANNVRMAIWTVTNMLIILLMVTFTLVILFMEIYIIFPVVAVAIVANVIKYIQTSVMYLKDFVSHF